MIHAQINADQLDRARRLYPFKSLKGSITKGKSNIYGAIGEILIWDQYKDTCQYAGKFDYDLIIGGQTVDVKTKKTTVVPKDHYFCSIADPDRNQDPTKQQHCDWYCFARAHENLIDAWILGWIRPVDFFANATYYQKGDIDPSSPFEWTFRENCWNLPISSLGELL